MGKVARLLAPLKAENRFSGFSLPSINKRSTRLEVRKYLLLLEETSFTDSDFAQPESQKTGFLIFWATKAALGGQRLIPDG